MKNPHSLKEIIANLNWEITSIYERAEGAELTEFEQRAVQSLVAQRDALIKPI